MKGKVLGFDPAGGSGVISGDDGRRYKFTAADNKSPQALKPEDVVDFEADGEQARNIYTVTPAAPVSAGAPGGSPAGLPPAVMSFLTRPTMVGSALVILGALIAGYLNAFSMMGLGGASVLYILLFALPFLAGGLIYVEMTAHQLTPTVRLAAGVAAIALPVLVPLIVGSGGGLGGVFGGLGVYGGDWFGFNITLPKILMVGGGVLILLNHFGKLNKLG